VLHKPIKGKAIPRDELGVGLVGFGSAPFALGEGVNFGGIDDADAVAWFNQELGKRDAVGARGLHADPGLRIAKAGQPNEESGETLVLLTNFLRRLL
jgi:hypothetical protein